MPFVSDATKRKISNAIKGMRYPRKETIMLLENGEKKCPRCKLIKKLDCFNNSNHGTTKREVYCKDCKADISMIRIYGTTLEQYRELLKRQDNKCAICGEEKEELVIDHSHKRNKVRGLLCRMCNMILGRLGDDYEEALIKTNKILNYLK